VLLAAEEAAGARALALIADEGHEPVLAVTTEDTRVAAAAAAANVPIAPPSALRDPAFAGDVRSARVDLLLNVHSLVIVRAEILRAPRIGSFNLHPGPLPRYAGLDTPSWAIFAGETQYGTTVHWMDDRVDTGPIAYTATFPVAPAETGLSLSTRCAREGLELVRRLLRDAAAGSVPSTPQDLSGRRYFRRGPPGDGSVDWTASAAAIERFVRACDYQPLPSPWAPAPRTSLDGAELRLLRVRLTGEPAGAEPGTIAVDGDAARVCAGDGWLEVEYVQVDGRTVPAAEALRDGGMFDRPA
jgi:UDP-4-amino-4-deoxy-L-arabinose formyltransferase/UDP-glucuronic acid dehydrogenase (UDP-4-keto-hexauronic acid decarboxylating)